MAVIVDSGGKVVRDAMIGAVGLRDPHLVRVVRALPTQAVEILRPRVVALGVGDAQVIIASPRVHVHRMVGATRD